MYSLLNPQKKVLAALLMSGSVVACAAAALVKSGPEHRFLPALPGDQMRPQLSFNETGGYLVTQDNFIDGNGLGIRARRYEPNLSASRWTIQVNSEGQGEQQNGQVAMLADGGAIFAWQGSTAAGNRIFFRVAGANGVFIGPDLAASAVAVGHQSDPSLAVLSDQTGVVVWTEWNRDGHMQGIFGQRLSASGARLGGTFQINESTRLAQRTPSVVALGNGNFAVAWVQELEGKEGIDIYARVYRADAQPVTSGKRVNGSDKLCANPSLASAPDGFRVAWSARKLPGAKRVPVGVNAWETQAEPPDLNSWDVISRSFDLNGAPKGEEVTVNAEVKGDQFSPRLVTFGSKHLAVWTSFGQDGADEGIFGRVLGAEGIEGDEFLVNSRTISKQMHPAVARAGETVLVAWTSFTGGLASYDVFAQNYRMSAELTLSAPLEPFVSSLSANTICVTWSEAISLEVASYLIYVDDETVPVENMTGMATISRPGWAAASTHTVRLGYRTQDGLVSPLSGAVLVKTWGLDSNGDGLPDDWQTENWGKKWPPAEEDSDLDGATNLEEFLAGTDPTSVVSVLRMQIDAREQGIYLQWNTEAGNFYQIQITSDFKTWQNVGTPRFAPSTSDSLPITVPGQVQYYRVIRMR
jgi:hypothetical protein